MPRTCPKCRANLAAVPVRDGKLRCPKCRTLFALARGDDRIQTTPTKILRAKEPEQANALPLVPILLGLGLGFIVLLFLGGGIAAVVYLSSTTTPPAVVSAPPAPSGNAAPVAQVNPEQAKQLNLPALPNLVNPEPVKEPIQPAPATKATAGGNGTLPLNELKAATVYVQAETATVISMGSGFVVHAQGATVFVVTNHHVIGPSPEKESGAPPQPSSSPQMPGVPISPRPIPPRPPFGPRMPIGPRLPRRRMALEAPSGSPVSKITVVLYSGTAKEQALPAAIVGDDAVHDLAVLRVVGVRDVPRPINYQNAPELRETMPAVMFGFPLGRLLDRTKKYPAITVTKGNVSSLRGGGGEMDKVQLDIDMNPGNSGGPVVDENGVLIGVAYSGLNNTHINFAIPVFKLIDFVQGRIDPPAALELVTEQGRQQIRVRAPAADPLGKLRSPTLLYGLATEVRMPQKGPNGWERLGGGKASSLLLQGIQATAALPLTTPTSGDLQIIAQVSYQTATGQT